MIAVSITEFGHYFLPSLLAVALLRKQWLLPAAFAAAILQSPAAFIVTVNVSKYGVTPFNVAALFIALDLTWQVLRRRRIDLGTASVRLTLAAWVLFTSVSVVGAIVLPRLFAGMPVYLLADPIGFDAAMTPLRPSAVNWVQAVNSLTMLMLFVYALQLPDRARLLQRCLCGLGLAVAVSVSVGIYQRLGWMGVVAHPHQFWASNPSYVQMWSTPFGAFERVSFPFVEPSFASAWYAAMAGGALSLYFFGKRWWRLGGLGALICALALINTLGFTGLLALAAFVLCLSIWVLFIALRIAALRRALLVRLAIAVAAIVVAIITTISWLQHSPHRTNVATAGAMLNNKLAEIADSGVRARSNQHALVIARDSYGLGVGSGSNRASNYFLSLLTNTGLAGLAAFLIAVALSWVSCARSRDVSVDGKAFVLGATACMLVAVAGGIPDQNWPPLWILLLTVFCACAQKHELPGNQQTQPPPALQPPAAH